MNNHVSAVCKSVHYHIRSLRHIHSSVSEDMAKMVACALVGSRLDYANSLLFGTTQKNISKLQKAQNLLARVVTCYPQSYSPCTLLQQLHWLPIKHRIDFKMAKHHFPYFSLFLNRLAYVHPCMPVIPLVSSSSPTLISSLLRLSAHHLALAALASQPLKSGTLFLYLSVPVQVLAPFVVTSRPTTASRPSIPLNPSPLAPQSRLC